MSRSRFPLRTSASAACREFSGRCPSDHARNSQRRINRARRSALRLNRTPRVGPRRARRAGARQRCSPGRRGSARRRSGRDLAKGCVLGTAQLSIGPQVPHVRRRAGPLRPGFWPRPTSPLAAAAPQKPAPRRRFRTAAGAQERHVAGPAAGVLTHPDPGRRLLQFPL